MRATHRRVCGLSEASHPGCPQTTSEASRASIRAGQRPASSRYSSHSRTRSDRTPPSAKPSIPAARPRRERTAGRAPPPTCPTGPRRRGAQRLRRPPGRTRRGGSYAVTGVSNGSQAKTGTTRSGSRRTSPAPRAPRSSRRRRSRSSRQPGPGAALPPRVRLRGGSAPTPPASLRGLRPPFLGCSLVDHHSHGEHGTPRSAKAKPLRGRLRRALTLPENPCFYPRAGRRGNTNSTHLNRSCRR
ncbi:protein of unknown function [Rhodococcus sp. RD6.2]|nr:protein of unknown function [Rhodococcus sp. RD6.2]